MNVLVLGDGLLGGEIIRQTGWDYLSRKKDFFDINNFEPFLNLSYDTIINCIANTDTYSKSKDNHWQTNCVFVDKLIDYCNENNTKLVHISTDYIYTSTNEFASESDVPIHSNNWYSYTKLISDGLVQIRSHNHLIIRCSHKPKPFPFDGAWTDQIGNFDYVDVISNLIIKLIKKGSNGVFNVGTELKTMYDLADQTKKVNPLLSPDYVPKNISMDLKKLKEELK